MEPEQVVAEELDRGLPQWKSLPDDLRPALERHCENLTGLVASLSAAGRDQHDIRLLVGELLRGYGSDLVEVLEARR